MKRNRRGHTMEAAINTLFTSMNRSLDRFSRYEEPPLQQARIRFSTDAEPECKRHDRVSVVEKIFGEALGELRGTFRKTPIPPNQAARQPLVEQAAAHTRLHGRLQPRRQLGYGLSH
jgi:hypothetical protein